MQKSKTRSASNLSFQVTELDESLVKKNKVLIWTVNGILFVISLILFIVGIVYLSGAYYAYSFTSYSTTLLAGLFIAFGAVCMALAAINVVFAQTHRNLNVLMGVTIISVFYLVLLAISIWGLSVTADRDKLKETLKINILTNLRGYEGNTLNKEETMKIDWLQSKFNCCGLNSYFDWQMYYQTSGASGTIVGGLPPTNWNIMNNQAGVINNNNNNNNNNPQSQPNVPDSCCVKSYPNCGKNYYKVNNNVVPNNNNNNNNNFNNNNSNYFQTVQGNNNNANNWEYYGQNLFNRYLLINLNGCLEVYLTRFYSDILFMTLLCFFSSLLALFLYIVLISASYRLNKGF